MKSKNTFLKNHVDAVPLLNVPLTNEIAERSLSQLENVRQPKNIAGQKAFKNLTSEERETLKKKLNIFEKKYLSFVHKS